MGFVSSLKFDRYRGAVLVNEEFMNVRYRRKLYLDAAQSLLTAEMADAWGVEAVYAGCGSPGVNQEVIDTVRTRLDEKFAQSKNGKKKGHPTPTLESIGVMCAEVFQNIIRRDQDLKLHLFYGFHADDLNRGSFTSDGVSFEIKQDKVKTKALDIINTRYNDRNVGLVKKTRALLFGYDAKFGISAYHLDISNGNVGFNMEAYEALGSGKYALQTSFAKFLNNVTYPTRARGFDPILGIYELILAALTAREAFHDTGGNVNIIFIDGEAKNHAARYREFVEETSRLALHIVMASEAGYVARTDADKLLSKVFLQGEKRKTVEKELFACSNNVRALDFILRGYKVHEVAEMAGALKQTKTSRTSKKRRKR